MADTDTVYVEYVFNVNPLQPACDILIAELGEEGFESFVENEDGVLAYIQKEDWDPDVLQKISILSNTDFEFSHSKREIQQENWNANWERHFEPISVGDTCVVRAPFHDKVDVEYDIVIMPKMSFGTGHHETTHMMLAYILANDMQKKAVLDMGSGTGVLAILAAMKGAKSIDAIDIDHWCFLNAKENVNRNGCSHIQVFEGDVALIGEKKYDLILANINRNILLSDIPSYAGALRPGGQLFLSGFFEEDLPLVNERASLSGLEYRSNREKNNWVAAHYAISDVSIRK